MFQAGVAEGERFFSRFAPDARAIADPERALYAAFGLPRGRMTQLLGPAVWAAGVRAMRKGHGAGRVVGDAFQMPGAFLVEGGAVTWRHEFRHAGDLPDFEALTP